MKHHLNMSYELIKHLKSYTTHLTKCLEVGCSNAIFSTFFCQSDIQSLKKYKILEESFPFYPSATPFSRRASGENTYASDGIRCLGGCHYSLYVHYKKISSGDYKENTCNLEDTKRHHMYRKDMTSIIFS